MKTFIWILLIVFPIETLAWKIQNDDFPSLQVVVKTNNLSARLPQVHQLMDAKVLIIRQRLQHLKQKQKTSALLDFLSKLPSRRDCRALLESIVYKGKIIDGLRPASPIFKQFAIQPNSFEGTFKHRVALDSINGLLSKQWSKLPEEQRILAQHYNLQLDQLNKALDFHSIIPGLAKKDQSQLALYQKQLIELKKDWSAYISLFEGLKKGTLDSAYEALRYFEFKLGDLEVLRELKASLPASGNLKSTVISKANPKIAAAYRQLSSLQIQSQKLLDKAKIEPTIVLNDVISEIAKKKKRYKTLPSTQDLSSAIGKNSLKEKTFKDRLVKRAYLNWNIDSLFLAISPGIGYRLNRKLTIGLAVNYRLYLKNSDLKRTKRDSRFSIRKYLQYHLTSGFLTHFEAEAANKFVANPIGELLEKHWQYTAFAGVGWESALFKSWRIRTLFLYNFPHPNSLIPSSNPWSFRFGLPF